MIYNFKKINIHCPNEITQIQFYGQFQEAIVATGRRHLISAVDTETHQLLHSSQIAKSQLTALHTNHRNILVGTGNGRLLTLDPKNLSVVSSKAFHTDCISDILEEDNHYVTVGYDGLMNFIDKRNLGVFRTLQLESPLEQVLKFNCQYYLAGVTSYVVDQNFDTEEYGSYRQFLETNGRLFGANDIHGLTYISMKDKKYVPCQKMVAYRDGVLGTSWQTATYFKYDNQERISWKSAKVEGFQKGDSITSLLSKDSLIFGGAESGNLYMFLFDDRYCLLDN